MGNNNVPCVYLFLNPVREGCLSCAMVRLGRACGYLKLWNGSSLLPKLMNKRQGCILC